MALGDDDPTMGQGVCRARDWIRFRGCGIPATTARDAGAEGG